MSLLSAAEGTDAVKSRPRIGWHPAAAADAAAGTAATVDIDTTFAGAGTAGAGAGAGTAGADAVAAADDEAATIGDTDTAPDVDDDETPALDAAAGAAAATGAAAGAARGARRGRVRSTIAFGTTASIGTGVVSSGGSVGGSSRDAAPCVSGEECVVDEVSAESVGEASGATRRNVAEGAARDRTN